jgi:hypothetical protein
MERKNEKPLIEHIKALEKELDETKKYYEARCRIHGGELSTLDTQRGKCLHVLSLSQIEIEEIIGRDQ